MKRVTILLLTLLILAFTIPVTRAGDLDYALLKDEYKQTHIGQSIIPFPWEPRTSERVLPFNYEVPAAPGNNLTIATCRDEFESASFILNAQKDISGIAISIPILYDDQGNSIPANSINIRTVKVWYQAGYDDPNMWFNTPEKYLAPELLLKDDSLIQVDYESKTNYLKATINGSEQYIDISNPTGTFPVNAQIHDAQSLQPFSLKANENKQIWVTVHVPNNTPTGESYGDISITSASEIPVKLNIHVTVLPFDLEPSPIEYGIYYFGLLPRTTIQEQMVGIDGIWKSPEKYAAELQDMKDHGVLYPTLNQWYSEDDPACPDLRLALSLRKDQTGLPTDKIYLMGLLTGNSTNVTDLTKLNQDVKNWKNITSQYGYQDVYVYGIDEAKGEILRSERTAWQTIHTAGAKVFVAVSNNNDAVNIVGDLLDVAVFAGPLNTTQAEQWHSHGKRIFSYANPQVGVENPEIYRQNYGFALWNAGYDGAMDYTYQDAFGPSIWNDFDSADTHFRDHVFAYPTSNGVIDTIEWEGWREGVDDTRYLASLKKHEGNYTSGRAIITNSLSNGENMATIRQKIIDQYLGTSTPIPTPTPTPSTFVKMMLEFYNNGVFNLTQFSVLT